MSTVVNIPGKWTKKGDFIPADGSAILRHDPNPEFTPTTPWGWTQEEIDADPIQAILEHTYGNCRCTNSNQCLQNIAAIGKKAKASRG